MGAHEGARNRLHNSAAVTERHTSRAHRIPSRPRTSACTPQGPSTSPPPAGRTRAPAPAAWTRWCASPTWAAALGACWSGGHCGWGGGQGQRGTIGDRAHFICVSAFVGVPHKGLRNSLKASFQRGIGCSFQPAIDASRLDLMNCVITPSARIQETAGSGSGQGTACLHASPGDGG